MGKLGWLGSLGSYFGVRALLLVTLALRGCGGSSGEGSSSLATPQSAGGSTSCPEAGTLCTGNSIIRSENGIAVTTSGGLADVRVKRDAAGQTTAVTLLLSKFGISWDGTTERPLIIETFETKQGRVQLNSAGIATLLALPPPTDINFYNYATKGAAGTQANYANNVYFPRTEPVRCPADNPTCPPLNLPAYT